MAAITAMITLPSFHFEYASPRALLRIVTSVSTPRVRLFHEAPGRQVDATELA